MSELTTMKPEDVGKKLAEINKRLPPIERYNIQRPNAVTMMITQGGKTIFATSGLNCLNTLMAALDMLAYGFMHGQSTGYELGHEEGYDAGYDASIEAAS